MPEVPGPHLLLARLNEAFPAAANFSTAIAWRPRVPRKVTMAVAASVCFMIAWQLPPPISHASTGGWQHNNISFSGAVTPVKINSRAGRLCRSHRGLHRQPGITMMPRCDGLDQNAVVLLPNL
jgi:hypothetical protein